MIDFTKVLTDLDDKPIREADGDLTLGRAARNALCLPYQDEQSLSGDDKVKRFMLAVKATGAGVTLTAEETALIKKVIAKAYGPLVVGRAWALLDPPSVPDVQVPLKAAPDGRVLPNGDDRAATAAAATR